MKPTPLTPLQIALGETPAHFSMWEFSHRSVTLLRDLLYVWGTIQAHPDPEQMWCGESIKDVFARVDTLVKCNATMFVDTVSQARFSEKWIAKITSLAGGTNILSPEESDEVFDLFDQLHRWEMAACAISVLRAGDSDYDHPYDGDLLEMPTIPLLYDLRMSLDVVSDHPLWFATEYLLARQYTYTLIDDIRNPFYITALKFRRVEDAVDGL